MPALSTTKRGLTIGGGEELIYLGEAEWQFVFADSVGCTFCIIIDGEGLAPVALAAEDRVTQTIVRLDLSQSFARDVCLHLGDGIRDGETGDDSRVDEHTALAILGFLPSRRIGSFFAFGDDNLNDRQAEVTSEGKVTAVVSGDSHYGPRPIAS